jgi:putative ABC transport system ATP-binding protein
MVAVLAGLEIRMMMTEQENVIKVEDMTKVYQMGEIEVHALRGVSFSVRKGEVLAITGP